MMSDLSYFEDGHRERDISIIVCQENKEKIVSEDLMEVFFLKKLKINFFKKKSITKKNTF